jgi:hypothetical protein
MIMDGFCPNTDVDASNGREIAGACFPYPCWAEGRTATPRNRFQAASADYLEGLNLIRRPQMSPNGG